MTCGCTCTCSSFVNVHVLCIRHPPTHFQLSRDKKTLEEKLGETQAALETEENKSKQEHRQRVKLESSLQDVEEKLDRETNVRGRGSLCVIHW